LDRNEHQRMTEFDYAGWVARAQAFVDRIAGIPGVEVRSRDVDPPLAPAQVDRIAAAVGRPIPEALRRFLADGAGRLDCAYGYEPVAGRLEALQTVLPDEISVYGGARLCAAAEMTDYARSTADWARETWVADDPDQRTLWEAGLPFAALDNGDFLALDTRAESPDPAVLYLCHDDSSAVLAPRFTEFLTRWEQLCYIGPEHWLLEPFLGPDGTLDAGTERAKRLRALFRDHPTPAS
jgi:hypothetical protein